MQPRRVVVVGAGAIGASIGALLFEAVRARVFQRL